jgi:integrase
MTPKQLAALPLGTHPIKQHPGLRLEVRQSTRTWTLRRRDVEGKLKQQVLGHYPDLSLAGAMTAAEQARSATRVVVSTAPKTVRELVQTYVTDHIRARRKNWRHSEALIWRHVTGAVADMAGVTVGRADAYALLSGLADRPAVQRILKMELSATWEHAMACGLMPDGSNPWAKQRVAPAGRKDRVLSDTEVTTLVGWLRGDGLNPTARDVLLLTLGTGARSGEVVGMRWKDVDLKAGEWRLPTSKNGLGRVVYLNGFALDVLRGRDLSGEHVFTMRRQQMVSNAVNRSRAGKDCPVRDWPPHDLRRTMRTGLARLGVSHEVSELCLGHRLGGVAGVYNLYQYGEEQRAAMEKWGEHLKGLT